MALCDIAIELDGARTAFSPGDPIAGRVRLVSHDDIECRRIVAFCDWRTRGRSRPETGGSPEIELAGGRTLRSGETAEYAFRFDAAEGPFTYRGRTLGLEWRVGARIETGSGAGARTETSFTLLPGEAGRRAGYSSAYNTTEDAAPQNPDAGVPVIAWIIGALGVVFLGVGGLLTVRAVLDAGRTAIEELILGIILMAFGALGAWQIVALRRAGRTIANTVLHVGTPEVRAGETLRVSLEVPGVGGVRIRSASIHLICEEVFADDERPGRLRRTAVRESQVAGTTAPTDAGKPLRLQAVIRIPENAPLSFRCRTAAVAWVVEARLNLPLAPDIRARAPFIVRP